MSLKDTTFKYYSASNSHDLAKVGYESTLSTSLNLTPPSAVVSANRRPSAPEMVRGSAVVHRADSSRQLRSSRRTVMTTEFGVEGGESTLRWSDQVSSVCEIIDQSRECLPLIAVVRRGYSGHEDGHQSCHLTVGQVLQVTNVCEQVRIKAKDETGRELSIPYNFPLSVRQKTTTGLGQPMRLSEAIEDGVLLPLTVRIIDVIDEISPNGSHVKQSRKDQIEYQLKATDLTVTSVYHCKLLTANVIKDGWLNPQQLLIPGDIRAEVSAAIGLKGATPEEWTDYRGMFARAARQHRQDHVTGYNSIYYMDWSGRQPPQPEILNDNKRLNVSPYIISNNTSSTPGLDHLQQQQQSRDLYDRRSASSSALTSHRPLPPYRPPGGATSVSASCVRSVEVRHSPALTGSTRDGRRIQEAGIGSLDCILAKKPVLTSSLSSSSSHSSSKSLPVTSLDTGAIEIEMCQIDANRSIASSSRCQFEPEITPFRDVVNTDIPAIVVDDVRYGMTSSTSSVALQLPTKTFPPTNCPRMGKRQPIPVALVRNSSSDVIVGDQRTSSSTTATTTTTRSANALPAATSATESNEIVGFGGSMPCLPSNEGRPMTPPLKQQLIPSKVALRLDLQRHRHVQQQQQQQQPSRVRFSADFSNVSTSSTNCIDHRSFETSGSSLFDEEGYYTKESSISGSSLSGTSSSNGTTSSRRLLDIEPAFF